MGQKVHPIGFRLGVNKDWQAHWFASGKKYAEILHEDLQIRDYIRKRFKDAGISKVIIDRAADKVSVTILTSRPGLVIGRRGQEVESLRNELIKLTGRKEMHINVEEVRTPEIDAELVAQNIASKIEQRVSHRRAMKRAVELAMRSGAKGIKVQCKGRLGGAEIARKEWYHDGRVPLQTIRADIDYAEATAITKYGTIGVKVWIYKGDILKPKEIPEEEVV
ncbi:MAG: 30S ribosomal protein S3 [Candidatus Hydrothermota bacterium]|nr:MAG: 30S ribosomal protein S3 [Candidatus Hydrothermae bacterium]